MNKIIRGCWQLATGHSDVSKSINPILDSIENGFATFDCADIYLDVESLLGEAIKKVGKENVSIHTKFVPDLDVLQNIDSKYIERIIDRSLGRLQIDTLDLVQFHWWDWDIKNYLYTMAVLNDLKAKGKIAKIGLTNVNTQYLDEFSSQFPIESLQCQVSLFDRRIERGIGHLCKNRNIKVLAYGTLLGGFISEKWIGEEEPQIEKLANRSLIKYKLLIDEACGWDEYQRRLLVLQSLATKYNCDIANIAIAALLQAKKADSVIVGLSPQNYLTQNKNLEKLPNIAAKDLEILTSWDCNLKGDAYDAERDKDGSHAKVMKYNLNSSSLEKSK